MIGTNRRDSGYILITTMIALGVVALLGTAALGWALTGVRLARKAVESEQAFYLANAGVEEALARLTGGQTAFTGLSGSLAVGTGLTGTYSVTFAEQPDKSLAVTSQGRVGGSTRVVTARMIPGQPAGGGTADSGTVPAPPGVSSQVFAQAIFSNGSLAFDNNAVVCGNVNSVGSVILENNSLIRGTVGYPCTSIVGTGKLVANGTVSISNNSGVAGGWCDATHWGRAPYPCATKPAVAAVAPPDLGTLYSLATIKRTSSAVLMGTRTFNNDIVYIDGNLTVDKVGAAISGAVTLVATGSVSIDGDLLCAGSCSVAVIAGRDLFTANNTQIWATLIAKGQMALGNQVTVHGNLQAGTFNSLNGGVFYPVAATAAPAPTAPTGPAMTDWNS